MHTLSNILMTLFCNYYVVLTEVHIFFTETLRFLYALVCFSRLVLVCSVCFPYDNDKSSMFQSSCLQALFV